MTTALVIFTHLSNAQLIIEPGPGITPEDMVEYLIGPGVFYDNVTFQGADTSRGIFSSGNTTNLGVETGIFLTSGSGYVIPGPNISNSAGSNNAMQGHPLLDAITTTTTYDAAVLEFDFIPLNDTVKCDFVFGSEEYHEWVGSSFNDVFGFFITGPEPGTGNNYVNKNIALVPGTNLPVSVNNVNNGFTGNGPCTNCEYFVNNSGGMTIEYDGFTTVITLWALVVPDETYHFAIGVADAADHIYDSGVLIEGTSFKSLGPPVFLSFDFLMEDNPELPFNITGEISDNQVILEVPDGTDVSSLVADFYVRGVEVFVDELMQEPGVTANDFSEPVNYHLKGYAESDWTVQVDLITDTESQPFEEVVLGPSPSCGKIIIENGEGIEISVFNLLGNKVYHSIASGTNRIITVNNLSEGLYLIELSKGGKKEVRKIIVY